MITLDGAPALVTAAKGCFVVDCEKGRIWIDSAAAMAGEVKILEISDGLVRDRRWAQVALQAALRK